MICFGFVFQTKFMIDQNVLLILSLCFRHDVIVFDWLFWLFPAGVSCAATTGTGQTAQGECYSSSYAATICPMVGLTVAPFSNCGTNLLCCYSPGILATTQFPGQLTTLFPGPFATAFPGLPGTGNVCGVSLQNRQNPGIGIGGVGLGGLVGTSFDVNGNGVMSREEDKPPRLARILGGIP